MKKPELVVPSPNETVAKLAMEMGADAVYLPITGHVSIRFGSRFFSIEDIPRLARFAEERKKRVFVVANGFPRIGEEKKYQDIILKAMDAGAHGVVIGSIGLLRWAAQIKKEIGFRGIVIASGVVSAVSSLSSRFLSSIGVDRVIVPRLLSISELSDYSTSPIEFDVFTHAFICSAWDGKLCKLPSSLFGKALEGGACITDALVEDGDNITLKNGRILKKKPPVIDDSSEKLSFSKAKPMLSPCFCDFETLVEETRIPFQIANKTLQSELFALPRLIKMGTTGLKVIPEGGGEENIRKTISIWRSAIDTFIESPDTWEVKEEWMDWFLHQYPRVVFDATLRRDFI